MSRISDRITNRQVNLLLNSGECTRLNDTVGQVPRQLCCGISEQDTKKDLDGIGFLVSFAARSFNLLTLK